LNPCKNQQWFRAQQAQLLPRQLINGGLEKTGSNQKHSPTRLFSSLLALALLLLVSAAACGNTSNTNDEQSQQFPKITETERIFTVEDFLSVGFKQSKDYDVTELPAATSAIYGFWKPGGGESVDYEIRFYPSHDDAVTKGTFFADEVTGPDGAVSDKDVTWKEGTRDRRTSGFTIGGGGGSLAVKYADYIIHSNVIMLCQGRDKDQSLDHCQSITNAVIAGGDQ
jgi:hypothetical protein